MKVLFSAVGGSDPIKRMLDGPMIHCCRILKPDIVFLYFTREMLKYENKDNRYIWCLKKLGEKLEHKFEVEKIERPKLEEVQLFDSFYEDLENIFTEIITKYPDAQIYANASSGTPAIKSAIVITAAMSDMNIKVVQVSSGEKKPLHDRDRDDTYDKEEQWECNEDNEGEAKDRTTIIESPKFIVKVKKENIRRYIKAYDYSAALSLAEEIKDYISGGALQLIRAANGRERLDYGEVKNVLLGTDYDIISVKKDGRRELTEYLLWLGIALRKKDYLGFIRGITPAAMALMETAVENKTAVGNIRNYCEDKNGHFILSRNLLERDKIGQEVIEVLDDRFKNRGGFQELEYTTAQLEAVVQEFCDDSAIREAASKIRSAEDKLRNPAAHTIISIGDDVIKRRIGISAEELYKLIVKMAVRIGLAPKDVWNSYDEMNDLIIHELGM